MGDIRVQKNHGKSMVLKDFLVSTENLENESDTILIRYNDCMLFTIKNCSKETLAEPKSTIILMINIIIIF